AQGVMSTYKGKALGTIGHLGTYSFHETKNYTCGEGGALLINDSNFIDRALIIREKGTNRSRFLRGQIDKYSWVDAGSTYLPSELNAAMLYAQFECAEKVNAHRRMLWRAYYERLKSSQLELQVIPEDCENNGHLFYIKTKDINERTRLINYLSKSDIQSVFHYVPLHSSEAGLKYSRFSGIDKFTTIDSNRLLRLPFYYSLTKQQVNIVCDHIFRFYEEGLQE